MRGLNAVDIDLDSVDQPTRAAIIAAAGRAGMGWGGNFQKPDPNHFYFDPGGNRPQRIANFSAGIQSANSQTPDY